MVDNIYRGVKFLHNFGAMHPGNKQIGCFGDPLQTIKPIEIAEKYETTYFDGDALLAQSETKEGVEGIVEVGLKGEEWRSLEVGDPKTIDPIRYRYETR